jgi:hypothetical protein
MRKRVVVDTPHPTTWETAKKMGVSKKRTLELIKLAHEIYERREKQRKEELAAKRKQRLKTA